jgi:murein DD-endopeptidase MepM/ murein hydrolase activator NlpD
VLETQIRPTTLNLEKVSSSVIKTNKSINLTNLTNQSIVRVTKNIGKNNIERYKLLKQKSEFAKRQLESQQRQDNEAQLEASEFPNVKPQQGKTSLQTSARGSLFGRLLGFFGYIASGWVVKNLPTWTAIGNDIINRLSSLKINIATFLYNLYNPNENPPGLLQNFTKGVASTLENILTFNFGDIPKDTQLATKGLSENITNMGESIKDSLRLLKNPLDNGDENTPPLNSEIADEGAYTTGYTSTMGGRVLATGAKATYYDPALGGINASGAKTAQGLPATATGEGYKSNVFSAAAFPELIALLPNEYTRPASGFPGGKTLAKPINLIVTDSKTGKSAVIRVNDVGPGVSGHAKNHMLDLSVAAKNYFGAANISSGLEIKIAAADSQPGPLTADKVREVTSASPSGTSGVPAGQTVELKGFSVETPGGKRVKGYSELTPHHDYQKTSDGREVRDFTIFKGNQYINAPVPSPVSGKVAWTGYTSGGGNWVEIMSGAGKVELGHFNKISVKAGQQVSIGTILGLQGSTGRSTGPHVHIQAPSSVIRTYVDGLTSGSIVGKSTPSQVPQAITPERKSVDIFIPETPSGGNTTSQQSTQMSTGIQRSPSAKPKVSEYSVLNRFIKNKLLLDLAYN